jgi:hypothetical protein
MKIKDIVDFGEIGGRYFGASFPVEKGLSYFSEEPPKLRPAPYVAAPVWALRRKPNHALGFPKASQMTA